MKKILATILCQRGSLTILRTPIGTVSRSWARLCRNGWRIIWSPYWAEIRNVKKQTPTIVSVCFCFIDAVTVNYTYMGNFLQISATVALTSALVPSKSRAVRAMQ